MVSSKRLSKTMASIIIWTLTTKRCGHPAGIPRFHRASCRRSPVHDSSLMCSTALTQGRRRRGACEACCPHCRTCRQQTSRSHSAVMTGHSSPRRKTLSFLTPRCTPQAMTALDSKSHSPDEGWMRTPTVATFLACSAPWLSASCHRQARRSYHSEISSRRAQALEPSHRQHSRFQDKPRRSTQGKDR